LLTRSSTSRGAARAAAVPEEPLTAVSNVRGAVKLGGGGAAEEERRSVSLSLHSLSLRVCLSLSRGGGAAEEERRRRRSSHEDIHVVGDK